MRIRVQLAQSKSQHEQALRLLQVSRNQLGMASSEDDSHGLWVVRQHALPSTNTIVALEGDEVVGAISLFGESAFGLPLEEQADLSDFRAGLEGRIGEFSLPGTKDPGDLDVLYALHHYAFCFGSTYCHYDAFVTHCPQQWAERYQKALGYEPLLLKQKLFGPTFYRGAREGADCRREISAGREVDFIFPEKKFFLLAHQSMTPETIKYLFEVRTKLFEKLTDLEIRVLKNYYDFGEYAKVLPDRKLDLPFKKLPKFRRFAMNCDGFLCQGNGKKVQLQVLDVSRDGIKIRTEIPLRQGDYPLTLAIGVLKTTEIITHTVWCDPLAQITGLEVKSGDHNWQELIRYLEDISLRTAA